MVELRDLERKIDNLKEQVEDIHKEVGAKYGQKMSDQIEELIKENEKLNQKLDSLERNILAIRQVVEENYRGIKTTNEMVSKIDKNTDISGDSIIIDDTNVN